MRRYLVMESEHQWTDYLPNHPPQSGTYFSLKIQFLNLIQFQKNHMDTVYNRGKPNT